MGRGAMQAEFKKGDKVCLKHKKGRVGVVVACQAMADSKWVKVDFGDGSRSYEESSLELWEPTDDVKVLIVRGAFGDHHDFSRNLTYHKLSSPLTDHLYSMGSSRTRFYHWQFKPVLKFLDSERHRLLIADEVGLGKTIEAGFILKELRARQSMNAILIVCPAGLQTKWQTEMKNKFGEDFEIFDAPRMCAFLKNARDNPLTFRAQAIASIQMLRRDPILPDLEATGPSLDLCVIDEAHYMRNRETRQNRLGRALSQNSSVLLLLTATPVHLGSNDLFTLLEVLDPDEFPNSDLFASMMETNRHVVRSQRMLQASSCDLAKVGKELQRVEASLYADAFVGNPYYPEVLRKLAKSDSGSRSDLVDIQRDMEKLNLLSHVLTRTRKVSVWKEKAQRSPQTIEVQLTDDEKAFYDAIIRWCKDVWDLRAPWLNESAKDFLTMMVQRQTASCIPAAVERYLPESKKDIGADRMEGIEDSELDLDTPEVDWADLKERGLGAIATKYRHLLREDTKLGALLDALQELDRDEPRQKVIIFSFFKATLNYLEKQLHGEGYTCAKITGDVKSSPLDPEHDDRATELRRFRDDSSVCILLSSAVGSEGIDLQFCHNLINYDLPWNPMVVEQRIGRVDRIGQEADRISIVNFAISGTIEGRILKRLYNRTNIFKQSIGDLEGILGQQMRELRRDLLRRYLRRQEQERRIDQTATALEYEKRNIAELEESGKQLIGTDQFFLDEIDRIRRGHRYVSPDELFTFVHGFLQMHVPKAKLIENSEAGVWRLEWCDELGQLLRKHLGSVDVATAQFIAAAHGRRSLRVTFDNDIAFRDESVYFVHAGHPVIRAIVAEYALHQAQIHPVAQLKVQSKTVVPGDYVYVLYRITAQAARPSVETEVVVLGLGAGEPVSAEAGEILLGEMSSRGELLPGTLDLEADELAEALDKLDKEFGARLRARKEDIVRSNAALVERQLQSLKVTFDRLRKDLERRLVNREEADERYIRMIEAQLRNKREHHEMRLAEIEHKHSTCLSFEMLAGGIVRVH